MNHLALRTLSCFTGGYGLELGLELAFPGLLEPMLYVEGEVTCAGFLASLVEAGLIPAAPVWSDVRTVGHAKVRAYLRRRAGTRTIRGAVEAITGGYPCPDFSSAGKRRGFKGEKGKLWLALRDAIRLYRPEVAFLENVGGHLRRGFQRVRRELREMGYSVTAGLFTAEEVGDTQKRERLFILAFRPGFAERKQGNEAGSLARCEPRQGAGGGNEHLARTDQEGLQGRGLRESGCADERASGQGVGPLARLPLFPPRPDSLNAWLAVLRGAPWLAPAIPPPSERALCLLAHGLARVDVLRILGNGVVPLQAAYAFRTLAASAGLIVECELAARRLEQDVLWCPE